MKIGTLAEETVQQIRLHNASLDVSILTYGATIQSVHLNGYEHSLVLGSNSLFAYQQEAKYFGAVVGRVANRVANGHAVIAGKTYLLPLSPPEPNQLHGGPFGTGNLNWAIEASGEDFVHLQVKLADGHMGYPGNMLVNLIYRLIGDALEMEIEAVSDQTTLCNFAGHSYFNLDGTGSILDHSLSIHAESYLPVDDNLIPTGEIKRVEGTAFDYRTSRAIGSKNGTAEYVGLDTNFCLSDQRQEMREVATLIAPKTGLTLTYQTTETGLQVYDGRYISLASELNINQGLLRAYSGVALEAQAWPDAVHHSVFPSVVLNADQLYQQRTRYQFN
ncbi:galactose mutarotase [Marinomonas sp. C1424]|uniref:Aldose 1-epimerase n=1 Tax=Marinomonas transparens TaxID=2795388 RepID=A0A934JQF4_9GAMM|nr:galactose mutarotase [Marinomonas transparens]